MQLNSKSKNRIYLASICFVGCTIFLLGLCQAILFSSIHLDETYLQYLVEEIEKNDNDDVSALLGDVRLNLKVIIERTLILKEISFWKNALLVIGGLGILISAIKVSRNQ